jgi:hypothetical protein
MAAVIGPRLAMSLDVVIDRLLRPLFDRLKKQPAFDPDQGSPRMVL